MIILCGTNRPEANTRKVAKHAFALLQNKLARHATLKASYLDLADFTPDIFDPACYAKKPSWFDAKFQAPITTARGIVVFTPEYNGSFPGVLKYFIDMLKFPESLVGVPIAFVGVAAGQFGAMRSVEQLELIFHYRSAHIIADRLFVPKVNDVIQADGSLGPHEERLDKLLGNFVQFVTNYIPQK